MVPQPPTRKSVRLGGHAARAGRALLRAALRDRGAPRAASARRGCRQAALGLLLALALPLSSPAWQADRMLESARRIGPRAVEGALALQATLVRLHELDDDARLDGLNRFYNGRILFRDDAEVWGEVDHWASPLELLDKGLGDCEDYAIAKYFGLLALGLPAQRLRLVYVRAQLAGSPGGVQAHMVLAYYPAPAAEPLILDNLIDEIRPASRRPDLHPVFSFNSEGLWQGTGGTSAGNPTARLSRWRDVLGRAAAEGFL